MDRTALYDDSDDDDNYAVNKVGRHEYTDDDASNNEDVRKGGDETDTNEVDDDGEDDDFFAEIEHDNSAHPPPVRDLASPSQPHEPYKVIHDSRSEDISYHAPAKPKPWNYLRHTTISRDQSQQSDYRTERLYVLRSSDLKDFTNPWDATKPFDVLSIGPQDFFFESIPVNNALPDNFDIFGKMDVEQSSKTLEVDIDPIIPVARDLDPSLSAMTTPEVKITSVQDNTVNMDRVVISPTGTGSVPKGVGRNSGKRRRTSDQAPTLGLTELKSIQHLTARIAILEQENKTLRGESQARLNPTYETCHRVLDGSSASIYLGQPFWVRDAAAKLVLKGTSPVSNMKQYAQQRGNVAFVVTKIYSAAGVEDDSETLMRKDGLLGAPKPVSEEIWFVSDEMKEAFSSFKDKQPNIRDDFPGDNFGEMIKAPYLFWYHYQGRAMFNLQPYHKVLIDLLISYIEESRQQEYAHVDDMFSRRMVSPRYMDYLVRPRDVLVDLREDVPKAQVATSWTKRRSYKSPDNRHPFGWITYGCYTAKEHSWVWEVPCWSYEYNGEFYKQNNTQVFELCQTKFDIDEEISMDNLKTIPLRFAGDAMNHKLESRGRMFWTFRSRRVIAYQGNIMGEMYGKGERFMVDIETYNQLHNGLGRYNKNNQAMDPAVMQRDEPPPAPDLYVFPSTILAYNFHRKKWVDLEVDRISDVEWNKRAFQNLVLEEDTKEIIQALVTNKIESEKGTDMIHSKGNGLIMLLHGGPGTGKTFTAESVAELAGKPLYPVTCGDIGTKPEGVEKYLESVFHLGKIWGCVVLLDEADVFLEQRTLSDLDRNALVSVFLRSLEYYDGILILTSNRVGIFDEAFKSRIQLALHYDRLGKSQRAKIWKNFFNRLRDIGEQNIDYTDIDEYYDDLAEHDLNGRQIRNSITIARQLAQFKSKRMVYAQLRHAIKISSRFDTYVKSVKEGFSDEQVARSEGLR